MRNYLLVMAANASRSVLNWVTIKIILFLSPTGTLGNFGQIQNITAMGSTLINFSSSTSVTRGMVNNERGILKKAIQLSFLGMLALLLVVLAVQFFGDSEVYFNSPLHFYFLSILLAISALLQAVVVAKGDYVKLLISNVTLYGLLPSALLITKNFEIEFIITFLALGALISNVYLTFSYKDSIDLNGLLRFYKLKDYRPIILLGLSSFANAIILNYIFIHSRSLLASPIEVDSLEALLKLYMFLDGLFISPIMIILWNKVKTASNLGVRNNRILGSLIQLVLIVIVLSVLIYNYKSEFVSLAFSNNLSLVVDLIFYSFLILMFKSIASLFIMALYLRGLHFVPIVNEILLATAFYISIVIYGTTLSGIMLSILISFIIYSILPLGHQIFFHLQTLLAKSNS